MTDEKLVAICRHELLLEEGDDINQLIREVKMVQTDSHHIYNKAEKKKRFKAREIMSGYQLAWEYVEGVDDDPGPGQRFWKGKKFRPGALTWPEHWKKCVH